MSWRVYVTLSFCGLATALLVAGFQHFPGYMDSDYYFAGGLQLARGQGFSEPYIWNYLDNPAGLPHASHSYWMPLASILTALGMWLAGSTQYAAGRLAFLVLAALVPVATARLAFSISGRVFPAIISGFLAVFPVYYAPFMPVPDNYGIYLVLGTVFLLAAAWKTVPSGLVMGMAAGAMTLARSDGLLWLAMGAMACFSPWLRRARIRGSQTAPSYREPRRMNEPAARLTFMLVGFMFLVSPWLMRNLQVYGAVRAPGADKLLWLATYDEIFVYPPSVLTPQHWLDQGIEPLLAARASALRWNMLNAFAAQGGIFLAPLILVGAWTRRGDLRVRLGVLGWFTLLVVMTLAVPAVGARGGWFHAGAGMQTLWWSLAPLGLEHVVAAAQKRRLLAPTAASVFGVALVGIAAIMTAYILWARIIPGWGEGEDRYPSLDRRLVAAGAEPEDVVMVRNPPGYFIMTGRSAIVIPYAGSEEILMAAEKYGAEYLVIEQLGAAGPIRTVYDDLTSQRIKFLGEVDGTRIFRILP